MMVTVSRKAAATKIVFAIRPRFLPSLTTVLMIFPFSACQAGGATAVIVSRRKRHFGERNNPEGSGYPSEPNLQVERGFEQSRLE
jgi:hypothetical protein